MFHYYYLHIVIVMNSIPYIIIVIINNFIKNLINFADQLNFQQTKIHIY